MLESVSVLGLEMFGLSLDEIVLITEVIKFSVLIEIEKMRWVWNNSWSFRNSEMNQIF